MLIFQAWSTTIDNLSNCFPHIVTHIYIYIYIYIYICQMMICEDHTIRRSDEKANQHWNILILSGLECFLRKKVLTATSNPITDTFLFHIFLCFSAEWILCIVYFQVMVIGHSIIIHPFCKCGQALEEGAFFCIITIGDIRIHPRCSNKIRNLNTSSHSERICNSLLSSTSFSFSLYMHCSFSIPITDYY